MLHWKEYRNICICIIFSSRHIKIFKNKIHAYYFKILCFYKIYREVSFTIPLKIHKFWFTLYLSYVLTWIDHEPVLHPAHNLLLIQDNTCKKKTFALTSEKWNANIWNVRFKCVVFVAVWATKHKTWVYGTCNLLKPSGNYVYHPLKR